jgi:hypothetical protein
MQFKNVTNSDFAATVAFKLCEDPNSPESDWVQLSSAFFAVLICGAGLIAITVVVGLLVIVYRYKTA